MSEAPVPPALARWQGILGRATALELAPTYLRARATPAPESSRPSAVLVLVGLDMSAGGGPALLVTRRNATLPHHAGQFAFPGGGIDPGETPEVAALREADEECALPRDAARILGRLPSFNTASAGWSIEPLVGLLQTPREYLKLRPAPGEVDEIFWVRFEELRDPAIFREEPFERGGVRYILPSYHLARPDGPRRIWGATALMIHHFLERVTASGKLPA